MLQVICDQHCQDFQVAKLFEFCDMSKYWYESLCYSSINTMQHSVAMRDIAPCLYSAPPSNATQQNGCPTPMDDAPMSHMSQPMSNMSQPMSNMSQQMGTPMMVNHSSAPSPAITNGMNAMPRSATSTQC